MLMENDLISLWGKDFFKKAKAMAEEKFKGELQMGEYVRIDQLLACAVALVLQGKKKPAKGQSEGVMVWAAYHDAFVTRHGTEPKRNAMTNAQAAGIARRLGVDDGMDVVRFYVAQNDAFYLKAMHPLSLCLKDAEGLYTKMKSGKTLTTKAAQKVESASATLGASQSYLARKHGPRE